MQGICFLTIVFSPVEHYVCKTANYNSRHNEHKLYPPPVITVYLQLLIPDFFIIILAGCLMYSPIRVQIYLCIKKAPEVYLHLRCFGLLCKLSFAGIVLVTAPRIRVIACSAVILPCIVRRITVVCRIVIRRVLRRCAVGQCIIR